MRIAQTGDQGYARRRDPRGDALRK